MQSGTDNCEMVIHGTDAARLPARTMIPSDRFGELGASPQTGRPVYSCKRVALAPIRSNLSARVRGYRHHPIDSFGPNTLACS
jgi:hypothetical protein